MIFDVPERELKTKKMNFLTEPSKYEKLKAICEENHSTLGFAINLAIDNIIKEYEREKKRNVSRNR